MRPGKKIGLALGSGGARGIAHLGAIRALSEAGLEADMVAGTSMGALIGMGLAAGRVDEMREVALHLDWKRALHFFIEAHIPRSGLFDGARVLEFIRHYAQDRRIEELDIPCAAVATNLATGAEVVLDEGESAMVIRASLAVPGLFTPVRLAGELLVDGGLVNPLPVNVARRLGADVVIAVDVAHFEPLTPAQMAGRKPAKRSLTPTARRVKERMEQATQNWQTLASQSFLAPMIKAIEAWKQEPGLLDVMGIAMRIMESQVTDMRFRTDPPDVLIRPDLGDVFFMEFHRAPEIEQAGYDAAMAMMPRILKVCGK